LEREDSEPPGCCVTAAGIQVVKTPPRAPKANAREHRGDEQTQLDQRERLADQREIDAGVREGRADEREAAANERDAQATCWSTARTSSRRGSTRTVAG
jgi:hypothetical protein